MRKIYPLLVLTIGLITTPFAFAGSTSCSSSKLVNTNSSLYLCNYFPEQKEFFYCEITNANSSDKISLHSEGNISISDQQELKDLPLVVVNNVAFTAQKPDAGSSIGFVKLTFNSEGKDITVNCQSGTGGRNIYVVPTR